MNEPFIAHCHQQLMLFFSAPLKRVVGVCGIGGLCVGRKDGFHFIKMAMVLAI